jgi:bacteriocin biosynthesis cyclodehydratase domain-containing protein
LPALSRYLNIRFDRPQAAGRALEQAHLGLIGTGVVGSRLTIALAQAGVGRITLFDDQLVGPEDRALSPVFATVPVGEPRAVALSEIVNGMMGRQVVHPLHTDACEAEPLHTYDLVLVAEDRHSPTLCQAVNTRALKHGFAWAAVSVDGLRGYAGPILIPGETGCYRCYEATDPYVLKAAHSHQAYLHHLESQSSRSGGPFTGLTAFADILVGFVVADLPAFLVEGRSQLLGQSVDFDFETLSMESRTVSRFPRCPTCGAPVPA